MSKKENRKERKDVPDAIINLFTAVIDFIIALMSAITIMKIEAEGMQKPLRNIHAKAI